MREDLLARIRKCLALAKSANEHEAAAALATARRLMDEYGVDQADVDTLDVGERVAKGSGAWTPSAWEAALVTAVTRAIPVKAISHGDSGWGFVGITPAPEIASYAFTALYRQLRRARAAYIATKLRRVTTAQRKTARADAFAGGWAGAVFAAIAAIYPKSELDPVVRTWLARRYQHLKTIEPRERSAGKAGENDYLNGHRVGRNVQLSIGVGAAAPAPRIGGAA